MSQPECEKLRHKVVFAESHLNKRQSTLALILILEDWVKVIESLMMALYSILCYWLLSPVTTSRVRKPFSILTPTTTEANTAERRSIDTDILPIKLTQTCWIIYISISTLKDHTWYNIKGLTKGLLWRARTFFDSKFIAWTLGWRQAVIYWAGLWNEILFCATTRFSSWVFSKIPRKIIFLKTQRAPWYQTPLLLPQHLLHTIPTTAFLRFL